MPSGKFPYFFGGNILNRIQGILKVGITEARNLNEHPRVCQRKRRFIAAAHLAQHIILYHRQLLFRYQIILQAVYFVINFPNKRLCKLVCRFRIYNQHPFSRIGHDPCGNKYILFPHGC